jgi:DNA polymerase III subunit delta
VQIKAFELTGKLKSQPLPQLIWLSGDETLLVDEAASHISKHVKAQGFSERELVVLEPNFKWDTLFAISSNMSLFGDKTLIDLRLNTLKLGRDANANIDRWLSLLDENYFVLIRSAKVDQATKNLKWFKTLDKSGAWMVPIWPINFDRLPGWIKSRAQAMGLILGAGVAEALAAKVEGNLLAAKQELEKIALVHSDEVGLDVVYKSVSDSSHYDVFQLADSMLGNDIVRTLKIFRSLLAEGVALQVILWAILKDLRELARLESSELPISAHKPLEYVAPALWQRRMPLFIQALHHERQGKFTELLADALEIDKASKGWGDNAELKTERLLVRLAGLKV